MLVVCALADGCARRGSETPPAAAISVTPDRVDVAIGSPLDFTYRFTIAPDTPSIPADQVVFVHFLDVRGERIWADDHDPPLPTGRWAAGATVEYTRTMFVPRLPYIGEVRVLAGLYSPRTGERVPLAGEDAGNRAYVVSRLTVRLPTDDVPVAFEQGWHEPEVSEDGTRDWQWSRQEATLSFPNPRRDLQLLLEVDQPEDVFPDGQQVTVALGAAEVDRFVLRWGKRELRRVALTAGQLGTARTVEIRVMVDKTFVPAKRAARSGDTRELGVRVFRAYVEPK
jgi:hypothetical protein